MVQTLWTPCTEGRYVTTNLPTWKHREPKHRTWGRKTPLVQARIASDNTTIVELVPNGTTAMKGKNSSRVWYHYVIYVHILYKNRWYFAKSKRWKSTGQIHVGTASWTIKRKAPKVIAAKLAKIKAKEQRAQRRAAKRAMKQEEWEKIARFEEVLE
jgi:hypothetical protein